MDDGAGGKTRDETALRSYLDKNIFPLSKDATLSGTDPNYKKEFKPPTLLQRLLPQERAPDGDPDDGGYIPC